MVAKIVCLALFSLAFCQVVSADVSIPVKNDISVTMAPIAKAGDSTELEKSRLQMLKDFFAKIAQSFIEMIKNIGSGVKDVFTTPGKIWEFIKSIPRRIWQFIIDVKDFFLELPRKAFDALGNAGQKVKGIWTFLKDLWEAIGTRVKGLAFNAVDTAAEGAFKLGDKYIEKNPEAEKISSDFDELENEEPLP